jgi:acyl-CoA ligase (AMP-forming) (exosortase A-associated)
MTELLSDLIKNSAQRQPQARALVYRSTALTYAELAGQVEQAARAFVELGLLRAERVGVYLPKQIENAVAMFGASAAGCTFVPVNPSLKARQVGYILGNCNVRVLVTSNDRLAGLKESLAECRDLRQIIVTDDKAPAIDLPGIMLLTWADFMALGTGIDRRVHRVIDTDMTAILYTSGSTGMPKGVTLSHRNMVAGARSVSQYLENSPEDRILSVLPLSFDAGLSQLTTGFSAGSEVILMNYLLPRDVLKQAAEHKVTGMTCVPPLWIQLADLEWPAEIASHMRYIATTGGRMPRPVVDTLRKALPKTKVYLMYGLTEAFRSTYLPPDEIDKRPDSIGKAIPNAEIMVVREDGSLCAPGEIGELVHRGALVSLGYWNDPERTAERFKPAPGQPSGIPLTEMAVWSGDKVRMDEDGFLYFVGRNDEMIKTSGFRVSPTELEEVIYASGLVAEVVAMGVPDDRLGQAIVMIVTAREKLKFDCDAIKAYCRKELPSYMVPRDVLEWPSLPRNPNGKIDRKLIGDTILSNAATGEGSKHEAKA